MSTFYNPQKELSKIGDYLSDIKDTLENAEKLIDDLEKQVCTLEEEVALLTEQNEEQALEINMLKMDLLRAQEIIDEAEYQSLNRMYNSPDRENRTVAIEVIKNLSND